MRTWQILLTQKQSSEGGECVPLFQHVVLHTSLIWVDSYLDCAPADAEAAAERSVLAEAEAPIQVTVVVAEAWM